MPGSVRENNADLRAFIVDHPEIRTVLDVGPGRGTYARVLTGLSLVMDAVEIWRPYIRRYDLTRIYRDCQWGDVRNFGEERFGLYDLVIFGDVLEHMTREDALAVWERARRSAKYTMMSVPIIHYPQGESHGNPYEEHVQDDLSPEDIRADYGPFVLDRVYETTGTFIAQGWSVSGNDCGIDHARRCCRIHRTHASPHIGCVLR